jgi:hypothetical protein
MRLSAVPLINFQGVNSFCTANQWIIRSGDQNTLYFQLIDLDQQCSPTIAGAGMCPQRYIAGIGVSNQPCSMLVTFPSIDCTTTTQIIATQNPDDGSIWSIQISPSQRPFGGTVQFALTQGNNVNYFSVPNMLCVEYPNCEGSDSPLSDVNVFNYNPFTNSGTGV